jgi:RNA polymerase sigma factor (sigma-70 family)
MPIEGMRNHEQDLNFAERVLAGQTDAASELRTRYHSKLRAILCARGANMTEAEDLLGDLWSDCLGATQRSNKLRTYRGQSALESWLATVATNALYDLKRRQEFRGELPGRGTTISPADRFDLVPGTVASRPDTSLVDLLRRTVAQGFSSCDPEALLMLKLVHIYEVTQRELGRMWDWHESKVSRTLDGARAEIKNHVLQEIQRTDPWLKLTWEDFFDLCRCSPGLLSSDAPRQDMQDVKVHQSTKRADRKDQSG